MTDQASSTNYRELGNQLFRQNNFTAAINMYTKGIEQASTTDEEVLSVLYNNRAACHLSTSNFPLAEADAQRSLSYRLSAKAYDRKGRALIGQQKKDEAIIAFEKAIELDPNNTTYKEDLARTLKIHKKQIETRKL